MFSVSDAPNHRRLARRADRNSQPHPGPTLLNPWRDDGSFRRVVAGGHSAASESNLAAGPELSHSKKEAVFARHRSKLKLSLAGHLGQQDPLSACSSSMSAKQVDSLRLQVWIRPRRELGHVERFKRLDALRTSPVSLDPVLHHH